MKKISLLALVVMAGFTAVAQDGVQQEERKDFKPLRTPMATKTRFGLMGGVNSASFNANNYGDTLATNSKTSFHFGGFVNVPLGGNLRFQPGVTYNRFGSKLGRTGSNTQDREQDLHYLTLPLMFQVQSPGGFFVEAGPQVGFLITARQEGPNNAPSTFNKARFDKLDVAAAGGIGYLTRIGLGFKANYYFGLANVLEDGGGNNSTNDGPELKNRAIQVGLVYHFGAAK